MAAQLGASPGDGRRTMTSPRPKGRENAKNVLCRNIGIYGHCRYEHDGCPFNHENATTTTTSSQRNDNTQSAADNAKSKFNVDSPAFTPLQPAQNGSQGSRSTTISPKSAHAAPFTPKTNKAQLVAGAATFQPKDSVPEFVPQIQEFQEFVPQAFNNVGAVGQQDATNAAAAAAAAAGLLGYSDPFTSVNQYAGAAHTPGGTHPAVAGGLYTADPTGLANAGYFSTTGSFAQPAQYHLYAPIGNSREKLQGYQRLVYDLFMPQDLREDLQRKAEASLRTLPSSHLPPAIEHYHTLYPLDTNSTRNNTIYGYPTWIYKATSMEDGKLYALRRIEGFRLTNEQAIRTVKKWKQVLSSSVVTIHDAFTTREFHDSSLIIVTDYHPCAKTVTEQYFSYNSRQQAARPQTNYVREDVLWAFIVQLASALKAIHSAGLAAQAIHPSKVLVTSKNRIRLNGCAISDIVKFEAQKPLAEAQADDFVQLGRLIVSIASGNANAALNMDRAMQSLARQSYTKSLRDAINWLLNPAPPTPPPGTSATSPTPAPGAPGTKDIDAFLRDIAIQSTRVYESHLLAEDQLTQHLSGELENGRLVRLLAKLGMVNERPEYEHNAAWAETGDRYYLKLFRDYVFHQVDEQGHPVTDLAHVITCLNKLDAGSEEVVRLVSRDEQHVLLVTYRELKRGVDGAFGELSKRERERRT